MIQVREIARIPELDYADYSRSELTMLEGALEQITLASDAIWAISDENDTLLIAGVINQTLLTYPRIWFLLSRSLVETKINYHLRLLAKLANELDARFEHVETLVQADWQRGLRFARFCGFRPTQLTLEINKIHYRVLER